MRSHKGYLAHAVVVVEQNAFYNPTKIDGTVGYLHFGLRAMRKLLVYERRLKDDTLLGSEHRLNCRLLTASH